MKDKKILVTGGAGFIGSALVWALNCKGIENILISDFLGTDEKWKNLVSLKFDDYIEADTLLDQPERLKDVDQVFHLGACSATTELDCRYLVQNNFEYTKDLCRIALENNSRFVYASSAATYGDGDNGMDDKSENLHSFKPLNMYGYSKHMFDLYAQKHGFLDKIVGLKYFNVFGPNENHKADMRSLVNKAFHQIRQCGYISLFKSYHPLYSDGEQKRDFLYVKDAVNMTLHLAETPEAGGLYNLGSGEANTWNELAKAIFGAMDRETDIRYIEMPEALQGKYQYYTKADISKLQSTGYTQAITPLADSVADYIRNYLLSDKYLVS